MKTLGIILTLAGTLFALEKNVALAADAVTEVRLYAIDCGSIEFKEMGFFADTGEYDGKSATLADSCYIVRHPKGTLLWDTGLGDNIPDQKKADAAKMGINMKAASTPLLDRLKSIGLASEDVTYLAFSHFHFDHTGDANLFGKSTWILNKAELDGVLTGTTPFADPNAISAYKTAKTQMITGDYDVFGDGSVRILKTPGHTPGHQSLLVKLKKTGTVILSGDLYHTLENREYRRVPAFNTERADTLASIDRIEKLVKTTHARFVIQHSLEDFSSLPKFPAYLQ